MKKNCQAYFICKSAMYRSINFQANICQLTHLGVPPSQAIDILKKAEKASKRRPKELEVRKCKGSSWLCLLIIWLGLLPARRQILERRSCGLGCVVSLSCPSCPDLWKNQLVRECSLNILSTFLAGILWTACQIQHVFKQTESDNCRLKVCSFSFWDRQCSFHCGLTFKSVWDGPKVSWKCEKKGHTSKDTIFI